MVNVLKKLMVLLTSLVLAALCWEAILATLVWRQPLREVDSEWGRRFPPYAQVTWGTEGLGRLKMDAFGFNNDELRQIFDFQTRIIVLGDSHTEALQVKRSDNFCGQLQALLGPNPVVINLGIGDNSMANHVLSADKVLHAFDPDIVIVQITADDFIRDAMNPDKAVYLTQESLTKYRVNTKTELTELQKLKSRFEGRPWVSAILDSSLVKFSIQRFLRFKKNLENSETLVANTPAKTVSDHHDLDALVGWQLGALRKRFHNVVLVYLPFTPIMDGQSIITNETDEALAIKDAVSRKAHELGIVFVDLTPRFFQMYDKEKVFPRGFGNTRPGYGHLNVRGHAAVAEELRDALYEYFGGRL